jgi:hypothetical protein
MDSAERRRLITIAMQVEDAFVADPNLERTVMGAITRHLLNQQGKGKGGLRGGGGAGGKGKGKGTSHFPIVRDLPINFFFEHIVVHNAEADQQEDSMPLVEVMVPARQEECPEFQEHSDLNHPMLVVRLRELRRTVGAVSMPWPCVGVLAVRLPSCGSGRTFKPSVSGREQARILRDFPGSFGLVGRSHCCSVTSTGLYCSGMISLYFWPRTWTAYVAYRPGMLVSASRQ